MHALTSSWDTGKERMRSSTARGAGLILEASGHSDRTPSWVDSVSQDPMMILPPLAVVTTLWNLLSWQLGTKRHHVI